jgi:hypothetical protein
MLNTSVKPFFPDRRLVVMPQEHFVALGAEGAEEIDPH